MIVRLLFLFLLITNSLNAQMFSIEQDDSLKASFRDYLNSPDKETKRFQTLLVSGQINRMCAIIAETMFKDCITEFNVSEVLSESEKLVQKKVHFRVDTTTGFLPTKSVSSRWVNGKPYIEYYPRWVLGFSNYLYADMISNTASLNRPYFNIVFRVIESVNHKTEALNEAYFDSLEFERAYSMEHIIQLSLVSYCSYLFIYLHELSHLIYPHFNEIDADKFAIQKITTIIETAFPDGSKEEDAIVSEKLNQELPENFSKYSFFYMSIQHLDYLRSIFLFPSHDYTNTIEQFLLRKKRLYREIEDALKCDDIKNISTTACKGLKTIIVKDEESNVLINQKMLLLRNWDSYKKNSTDTVGFFKNISPVNPVAAYFSFSLMLSEAKNYSDACLFLKTAISIPDGDIGSKELCHILLGKIYQNHLNDRTKAIEQFSHAKKYSLVMPESFYVNMINSL